MPEAVPKAISGLLADWCAGDREALKNVIPLLYHDLHKIAHMYVRRADQGIPCKRRP
jgi:hypothetical protein